MRHKSHDLHGHAGLVAGNRYSRGLAPPNGMYEDLYRTGVFACHQGSHDTTEAYFEAQEIMDAVKQRALLLAALSNGTVKILQGRCHPKCVNDLTCSNVIEHLQSSYELLVNETAAQLPVFHAHTGRRLMSSKYRSCPLLHGRRLQFRQHVAPHGMGPHSTWCLGRRRKISVVDPQFPDVEGSRRLHNYC